MFACGTILCATDIENVGSTKVQLAFFCKILNQWFLYVMQVSLTHFTLARAARIAFRYSKLFNHVIGDE